MRVEPCSLCRQFWYKATRSPKLPDNPPTSLSTCHKSWRNPAARRKRQSFVHSIEHVLRLIRREPSPIAPTHHARVCHRVHRRLKRLQVPRLPGGTDLNGPPCRADIQMIEHSAGRRAV